LVESKEH
jgi:hypothetical protein